MSRGTSSSSNGSHMEDGERRKAVLPPVGQLRGRESPYRRGGCDEVVGDSGVIRDMMLFNRHVTYGWY